MNAETIKNRLGKHFTREGLVQICEKYEITVAERTIKKDIIEKILKEIPEKKLSRIVAFPVRNRITILSVLGIVGLFAGIYVDVPDAIRSMFGKKSETPKTEQYSRSPKLDIDKKYFRIFVDSLSDKCKYSNEYFHLDSYSNRDLEFKEFKLIGNKLEKGENGLKLNILNLGETLAKDIKYFWKFDFEEFEKAYELYDTLLNIEAKKCCVTIEEEICGYGEIFQNEFYNMEETRYLQSISSIDKKAEINIPPYFVKFTCIYYNYVETLGIRKDSNEEFYLPKINLEVKFKDLNEKESTQEFTMFLEPLGWVQSPNKSQMIRTFEIKRKIVPNNE